VKEIYARLGLGRRTLYRRIADGVYPQLCRDGGTVYYLESVLMRLVQGGRQ
jgi:predicted DNA-binding transcriptional regulator AlpA